MSRFTQTLVRVVLAAVGFSTFAVAQESPPQEPAWRHFSFQPRPGSMCKYFMITETGALYRFSGTWNLPDDPFFFPQDEPRYFFTGDLGVMANVSRNFSLGGAFFSNISSDAWKLGIRCKTRYWLGRSIYGDFSPGLYISGGSSKSDLKLPGFSGQFNVGLANWVAVTIQIEVMRRVYNPVYTLVPISKKWTDRSWYTGIRFGSYPGVAGAVIGGVVGLLIAISYAVTDPLF